MTAPHLPERAPAVETGRPTVLVHEWIEPHGGAEKVVDSLVRVFPDADLVCLWDDAPGRFDGTRVRESALARTVLRRSKIAALPAMPLVWSRTPGAGYERAVVSTHLFAHHVRFPASGDLVRYVYVHTPARYLWTPELDPRGRSLPVRAVAPMLRSVDRRAAHRGRAVYAANSRFVADRVRDCWDVDARVIHPPVDAAAVAAVADWSQALSPEDARLLEGLPEHFVLGASRMVEYKRLDKVVDAGAAVGLPVVLAGGGPDEDRLRGYGDAAPVPVHLLGRVSDALLYALYQRCSVYAFLGVEDFGIMPVEAMAAGAAVVANRTGGAAESVLDGRTGALCDPDDPKDLAAAVARALAATPQACREQALTFDRQVFESRIAAWVDERLPDAPSAEPQLDPA